MTAARRRPVTWLKGALRAITTSESERPKTRGDCLPGGSNAARPCSFVSCKWHALLEIGKGSNDDALTIVFPDLDLEKIPFTCTLDVADLGGATLEAVARVSNVSWRYVFRIEQEAILKLSKTPRHMAVLGQFLDGRRHLPIVPQGAGEARGRPFLEGAPELEEPEPDLDAESTSARLDGDDAAGFARRVNAAYSRAIANRRNDEAAKKATKARRRR